MSGGGIRIEKALEALPDLDDLKPLREMLLDASTAGPAGMPTGSPGHLTVDRRRADAASLEERVPELVERVRERTERALSHVVAALRALERGDTAGAARELIAAGEVEEAAWRLDEATAYYRKALELGRKPRDRRPEGLALRRLGRVARTRGELAEALRLYREGFEISEAQRDTSGVVIGCLGVGHVYVDQGEWEEARRWYLRAVERLTDSATAEYLHLCNALSVVERRLGRFAESEEWLDRGDAAAADVDDPAARAYLEHGRARLYMARGDFDGAERVLHRLLDRELDTIARISTLINLSEPLLAQRRLRDAERVVRQAERLALGYGTASHLPHVYELLGRIATAHQDPDGFVFFEQALDVIREHGLPRMLYATVQRSYGNHEAALGMFESARARLEIARDEFRSMGAAVEEAEAEVDLDALDENDDPDGPPIGPTDLNGREDV